MATYAQCLGHTVAKLNARHLANATNIAQACRDAIMTLRDAPIQATHRKRTQVNLELRAAAELVFADVGAQLGGAFDYETTRQSAGDIDLMQHLKVTCRYQGRTHPLLILVDEIQDIEDILAKGVATRTDIKTNLKILNDDVPDENLPITTILAGLDPVRDIMPTLVSRPASGSDLQFTPIAANTSGLSMTTTSAFKFRVASTRGSSQNPTYKSGRSPARATCYSQTSWAIFCRASP